MGGKHSKQTEPANTPPGTDTQADAAPADTENDTTNTPAAAEAAPTLDELLQGNLGRGELFDQPIDADAVSIISDYAPEMATANRHSAASAKIAGAEQIRNKTITMRLLQAVVYGMESKDANTPVKASDAGNLFKSHLYVKELLQKSPEFLLARGDVTDWAGRTFKNITAFEYALWAKDFKMIEMMLNSIPKTQEGDEIWAELSKQANQVKAPIEAGGGLTYTHTYDRPNLDALGIPDGTTITVTETHTENHFDITPLCAAYQDYDTHFDNNVDGSARTWPQRDAIWTKLIGKLQRVLPVHILQRYCDPNMPFYPLEKDKTFHGEFKRSTDFYNYVTNVVSSLFGSALSSDFGLMRGAGGPRCRAACGALAPAARPLAGPSRAAVDLAAFRQLDEVSTNEIEKIIRQLSQPRHSAEPRP